MKYVDNKRVFKVQDESGEEFWYIDISELAVLDVHAKNYDGTNFHVTEVPPADLIDVDGIKRTAELWAQVADIGCLATTL